MSMHVQPLEPIPDLTRRMARTSFRKGTLAMHLRDALGPIYHDADFAAFYPKRGREAEAPWRLALVTVLQAAENLSDGQAAEMVRGRLDWKYALSLPLDDTGFDASILVDFRQRLIDHDAVDQLLEPILEVCRENGWLKQGGGQHRLDSTIVLGKVRRRSSLETVGETLRVVLNDLAEQEPEWVRAVVSDDWFDRYVHRFELQRFPKGKEAQEALVKHVGEDAWMLLEAAEKPETPKFVQECASMFILRQVWNQHYERVAESVRWRDGPLVLNAERIVSPHDTQVRESRKRNTEWAGYKVHLTETCAEEERVHLLVDVRTTPATTADVEETETILEALEQRGLAPQELLVDSGYMSAAILVNQRQEGRELIGPVLLDPSKQKKIGYGHEAFVLDWEKRQAICPQGKKSQRWTPGRGNRGEETFQVGFAPQECQQCPVKNLCTESKKGGRTLTLYPQAIHEALQERRREQQGEVFQKAYAQRSGIESTISEGVRVHGMRRSRYVGEEKTQLQMVAIASAMNLVRITQMLEQEKKGLPPRRKRAASAFARLQSREVA